MIGDELQALEEKIGVLTGALQALEIKITPVLEKSGPLNCEEGKKGLDAKGPSELRSTLISVNLRLENLITNTNNLIGRVEL